MTNKAQVAKIKSRVREAHEWFYLPRVLYWSPQVDIFSNIFEWPVRHSHCSTIETSYTKVAKTNTHSGTLENKHMCLFSNVTLWPINTHSGTLENKHMCLFSNVPLWVFIGHSVTLENKHMCLFSNVPLWVLVFATFVYDVSMVLQCECRTGHSKILENISTCGDQ